MLPRLRSAIVAVILTGLGVAAPINIATVSAQTPAAKGPSVSGAVKAVTPKDMVLTTAAGQEVAVTVAASAKVLIVPPGSTNLAAATPGSMADVAAGDRAIVTGTPGDAMPSINAVRVILMKSSAIASRNEATEQAWAQGVGGIVKTVSGSTLNVSSGMKQIAVTTTPATIVRRYAAGSVRFEDAVRSDAASIKSGDQVRVRGDKNADGSAITAQEIVAGTFTNLSGVLLTVDATAGSVTFKDLKTKKVVTVAISAKSDVRRLPPEMGARLAGRGARSGSAGGPPADGATPAGDNAAAGPGRGGPGGSGGAAGGGRRGGGVGADLSRMLGHLPTETIAGLKKGDAVMVVAMPDASGSSMTAITLLTGADPILAASPSGDTEMSPWSMGGGGGEGGGEGGGGGSH